MLAWLWRQFQASNAKETLDHRAHAVAGCLTVMGRLMRQRPLRTLGRSRSQFRDVLFFYTRRVDKILAHKWRAPGHAKYVVGVSQTHDVIPTFEVKNPVASAAEATGNWSSKVRK